MSLKEALENFAQKLRNSNAVLLPQPPPPQHVHPMNVNTPFYPPHPLSSTAPPTNIYSSVSPSTIHLVPPGTAPLSPTTMSSPNTTLSMINSPEKQPKAIPPSQQGQAPSAPATSPAVSTASTPVTVNASLKRKQTGDASSPTLGIEQPPPKPKPRKRGRTGTTGAG